MGKMLQVQIDYTDVFEFTDALSIDVERQKELDFQLQLSEAMSNPVSLV